MPPAGCPVPPSMRMQTLASAQDRLAQRSWRLWCLATQSRVEIGHWDAEWTTNHVQ